SRASGLRHFTSLDSAAPTESRSRLGRRRSRETLLRLRLCEEDSSQDDDNDNNDCRPPAPVSRRAS
ncbi:hypothetical protein THAOC_32410, partial [Thalassiosira oceanica]